MSEKNLEVKYQTLAAVLLAGGLAVSGCANHSEQGGQMAGYGPNYYCEAHMYQLGDVDVAIQDLDQPGRQLLQPSEIRVKPIGHKAQTQPAHSGKAHFQIPARSAEISVQAKVNGEFVSCGDVSHYPFFDVNRGK